MGLAMHFAAGIVAMVSLNVWPVEMLTVLRYDQMASAQTLTTQSRATTDWPTGNGDYSDDCLPVCPGGTAPLCIRHSCKF